VKHPGQALTRHARASRGRWQELPGSPREKEKSAKKEAANEASYNWPVDVEVEDAVDGDDEVGIEDRRRREDAVRACCLSALGQDASLVPAVERSATRYLGACLGRLNVAPMTYCCS